MTLVKPSYKSKLIPDPGLVYYKHHCASFTSFSLRNLALAPEEAMQLKRLIK